MTVHAIVPVYNRLPLTQSLVACLRKQVLNQPLSLLIINDSSTDGTAEWLAAQDDIEVLNGDGSLFWGGAVDLALKHLETNSNEEDWVLLMNNDTKVAEDFVQRLLSTAQMHAPAAVGSVIFDETNPHRMLCLGTHIDTWRLLSKDLLNEAVALKQLDSILKVDVLSGRGVLFPLSALIAAGGMRPRVLPHYLADYDVSVRVRKLGYDLLVLPSAKVYSAEDFGSASRATSYRDKLFSVRSPFYLPAHCVFWWEVSGWLQRLTLPLRVPLFILFPRLRKPKL